MMTTAIQNRGDNLPSARYITEAWPVEDVPEIFYAYLTDRGCSLIGPTVFDPAWPGADHQAIFRGPQFSAFSVLARREQAWP